MTNLNGEIVALCQVDDITLKIEEAEGITEKLNLSNASAKLLVLWLERISLQLQLSLLRLVLLVSLL